MLIMAWRAWIGKRGKVQYEVEVLSGAEPRKGATYRAYFVEVPT